ncbi:endoribonuclease MazF [Candidatus Aquiluna sp. UB-MaderosW2red]|uniref:endoribonuclease MazF n=1 Tax=Candidatus Aquiluna sp. UB-MaderosW2red TaxID=1855377 RepID=UPI000875E964|nr:endoribonuclease MazF [Candidatus Aquiluna sp. UB-MaderosW2red]SCX05519.1 mRNA interferase MazF [Candidatus Aquiluna sp. UB-MaderosW2red]
MAPSSYIPEAGDLVWLEFDPQAGHEQAGHRPALVISPAAYNAKSGLMLCCPVTTKIKGYPFEVRTELAGTSSVIIADQVKSLDFKARNAKKKGEVSREVLAQVRRKILSLVSGL